MNYIKARQDFFLKPLLKSMITSGYEREDIALEFSVKPDTINDNTKRFWSMTFTQTRFEFYIRPLLIELKNQKMNINDISKILRKDPSTIRSYSRKILF